MNIGHIFFYYALAVNFLAFAAFGIDKWKAHHKKWRISEATLLTLAAIGGSVGAWTAMQIFHHKTLHKKFRYGVPALLFIHAVILYFLMSN